MEKRNMNVIRCFFFCRASMYQMYIGYYEPLPEGLGVLSADMQLWGGGRAVGVGMSQGEVLDELGGEDPGLRTHWSSHWTTAHRKDKMGAVR